jgi:hypothetical protein
MGKFMLRRKEINSLVLQSATPGSRAVFLVEARNAHERRKVRELFEALAELGEVAPLADGPLMAYVVQVRGDRDGCHAGSLFSKIEATLKDEFPFSLVEQSFNDVVYHLVETLCADSGGQVQAVPRCGICNELDPFPTRITLRDSSGQRIIEACYCTRCSAQRADPDEKAWLAALLSADRRGLQTISGDDLIEWPADADTILPLPTYRLAS